MILQVSIRSLLLIIPNTIGTPLCSLKWNQQFLHWKLMLTNSPLFEENLIFNFHILGTYNKI